MVKFTLNEIDSMYDPIKIVKWKMNKLVRFMSLSNLKGSSL